MEKENLGVLKSYFIPNRLNGRRKHFLWIISEPCFCNNCKVCVSTCSLFMLTKNIKNNTERIENQINMLKAWYAVSVTNYIYSNWKTSPCAGQRWYFLSVFISTEEVLLFPLQEPCWRDASNIPFGVQGFSSTDRNCTTKISVHIYPASTVF